MSIPATPTCFDYTANGVQTNFRIGCAYSGAAASALQGQHPSELAPFPTPPTLRLRRSRGRHLADAD